MWRRNGSSAQRQRIWSRRATHPHCFRHHCPRVGAQHPHVRQADRDNGIARSGAHPCQRPQHRHHRAWRNPPPQQFVGGRQICRVGIERLLLQQVVYRCRRHRPRLRHHDNRHDGGKPQPRYDTNRAEDHRARRLIQIRTPRLQQDRRHKDVDHIITDSHISPSTAHAIEEMGIELTIVPVH